MGIKWKYQSIKISCKRLHSKLIWRSFVTKEVKNTVSCTCVIEDLNVEDTCGMFYENELQTGFKQFRVEKVVKKGDRL